MNSTPQVLVVGGGYAGVTAANRLCRDTGTPAGTAVAVTLLNARPLFVERIRLHQLAARTHAATADYAGLLADGVRLVVGEAARIDAAAREVVTADGRRLPYDHLVYAVGSTATVPASVPGAAEHAWRLGELEVAQEAGLALDAAGPGEAVTVVGGGLTGIEAAAELAERGRAVRLVCGGLLGPSLSARGRRSTGRWLARHGVEVVEDAAVVEVRPDAVVLDDGTTRPSAVTIWAAGFGVPDLARRSGLAVDELGRLLTDETLTSVDDERIVACGDAAAPSGRPLRMSCQAAGPLGAQAAETVLGRLAGTAPAGLDLGFVAQCVSLGRHAATFQLVRRDDSPVEVVVGGRAGALVKEAICRGTLWTLRREARRPGSSVWPRGARHGRADADGRGERVGGVRP